LLFGKTRLACCLTKPVQLAVWQNPFSLLFGKTCSACCLAKPVQLAVWQNPFSKLNDSRV